ncbi:MAG: D-alanine--D-alanine ligase, partial [Gammaproteobacteria bacterium]
MSCQFLRGGALKIVVLFGGTSVERDVSVASGVQVVGALRRAGHMVLAMETSQGVLTSEGERKYLSESIDPVPPEQTAQRDLPSLASMPELAGVDLVFLALHGGSGEDGTIQGLLHHAGIPFTGSGALGSALAMDKNRAKRSFLAADIPTPEWVMAFARDAVISDELGFPLIVKPNRQGSTVGLSLVNDVDGLHSAVEHARSFGPDVMLERYIPGRELTVGILQDEPLAVGEIIPTRGDIFDYTAKYQKGAVREIFPANLTPELTSKIQRLGLEAHRALNLSGYSRADFRMDLDGEIWCLEVNTLPGLTAGSLLPQSAAAMGIDFDELCERICASARQNSSAQI